MTGIIRQFRVAILLLVFFSLLTGLIYPAVVTGIAQVFFPWRANGSLLSLNSPLKNNGFIGSELIGQQFTEPKYFWGRPSATLPYPYNAENSSGSNLGPSNPNLLAAIKKRILILQQADPQNAQLIPVDLVTASGSGLDPEISPQAALYQISRIARIRGLSPHEILILVQSFTKKRALEILGEPRINVLELNLALDNLQTVRIDHG